MSQSTQCRGSVVPLAMFIFCRWFCFIFMEWASPEGGIYSQPWRYSLWPFQVFSGISSSISSFYFFMKLSSLWSFPLFSSRLYFIYSVHIYGINCYVPILIWSFPLSSSTSNSLFMFVNGNTWASATKGELWWNWGVGSFEEEVRMGRSRKARTAGPPISKSSRKFVCSDIFWYPLVSFCCPRPPLQCNEVKMDSRGKARKAGPSIACIVQVSSGILWYPLVPSAQCEEVKVGRRRKDMRARSPIFRTSSWQEGSDDHCKHFHLVFSLLKRCSQSS